MSFGPEEFHSRVYGTVKLGGDQAGTFDEPSSATFHRSADGRSFRVRADSHKFPAFWAAARLSVELYWPATNEITLKVQSSGGRLTETATVVAGLSTDHTHVIFREDGAEDSGIGVDVAIPAEVHAALLAYHSTRTLQ